MDINQLYAEFCNKFWIYFLGMESAQGRKTATFLKWKKRIPAVRNGNLYRGHIGIKSVVNQCLTKIFQTS